MGRVFKPKYAWTKADGTRVEKVTEAWYIEYTDASGRWVRRKAGLTKEQATDALRKAESDVLAEKNGLPTDRAGSICCQELCKRYLKVLKPLVAPRHWQCAEKHLREALNAMRAATVRDLTHEKVERFLGELDEQGFAARTINHYLGNLKAMLNWAVRARIIPYSPIASVAKRSEHVQKHARRALSDHELARLLSAAKDGPLRRAKRAYKGGEIPPEELEKLASIADRNVFIYRLLVMTGLRVNEARLLRWADIDFDTSAIITRPWWTGNKNGKEEHLPLAPALEAELRERLGRTNGDLTAPVVHVPKPLLRTLDDDLVAAGIARKVPVDKKGNEIPVGLDGKTVERPIKWILDKRDAAGRVVDLHALRHTYGTRLIANGADIKTTQALMRHSTPSLTLGIYVHKDTDRLAAAVAALPEIAAVQQTCANAAGA